MKEDIKRKTNLAYHRVVVKFGTNLLTGGTDKLDEKAMFDLVGQVCRAIQKGAQVIVVTSGAIASGKQKLSLKEVPRSIPRRQVMAAVGQNYLMSVYEKLFEKYNVNIAQALLTRGELSDRAGYLNTRNTLLALLDLNVVCIVNENDVVAIDEIEGARFGDNDNLSAMVANLVDADLLLILSDVIGLCTGDPNRDPSARLISEVVEIDSGIEKLAGGAGTGRGTGGMITKIEAAKLATSSGVAVVIARGNEKSVITRVIEGETVGIKFLPAPVKRESRERWLLSGLNTRGKVVVDDGGSDALKKQKRSLLAAGITEVAGDFQRGDIVDILDINGIRLGCGITNYDANDINKIKGAHSDKIADLLGFDYGAEIIHRNNLVITC